MGSRGKRALTPFTEYRWSSHRNHAVELGDYPIRPHPEWFALGSGPQERRRRYSELVADGLRDEEVQTFRRCARKGIPAGSDRFKAQIEEALARRIG